MKPVDQSLKVQKGKKVQNDVNLVLPKLRRIQLMFALLLLFILSLFLSNFNLADVLSPVFAKRNQSEIKPKSNGTAIEQKETNTTTKQNKTNVTTTKQNKTNMTTTKRNKTNVTRTKQNKTNVTRTKQNKTNVTRTKQNKTNVTRTKQNKTNVTRTKLNKTNMTRTKQNKTNVLQKLTSKLVAALMSTKQPTMNKTVPILQFFKSASATAMKREEKDIYLETLQHFDHIWRKTLNLTYFLHCGTLLGAVRHQEFIPWDDDLDLLIDNKDQGLLETVFKNTELGMRIQGRAKRKIFFKKLKHGMRLTSPGWNWPFLDIFSYLSRNNGSVLFDLSNDFAINSSLVFPLRWLSLEGHNFPAPRCPYKFLSLLYNTTSFMHTCCPNSYNHRYEGLNDYAECITCADAQTIFKTSTWAPLDPDPQSCEI